MLRKIQVGDGGLWKKIQNVLILKHKFIHLNNEYLISSLALVFLCTYTEFTRGNRNVQHLYKCV